ncbi:MAG: glycosyltransferase [Clostridiales bacterium]|nr:glycosyltransferase [Clostridiales bacterium]
MPTISVIVPVYKVELYLRRCIDSILGQTFTDFELILVDDGSPDNCGAICDEYAQKDLRVHVIHQENRGVSAARNAGIDWAFAHSDSEWISFVDSDDWVHPKMLECLMNATMEHNVMLSVCGYVETDGEVPEIQAAQLDAQTWFPENFFILKNGNAIIPWGKLYKKRLFEKQRFPEGRIHEDEFATYKVLFACRSIAAISAPLYYYFKNSDSITKSGWTPKRFDKLDALDEQADFFRMNGFKHAYDMIAHWHIAILIRERENVRNSALGITEKIHLNWQLYKNLKSTLQKRHDHSLYIHALSVFLKTTYVYHICCAVITRAKKLRKMIP